MTAKTNAERQAALKQRRKDAGLVSLKNVWVDPDDVPEMRVHAAKLARKRAKTEVRFNTKLVLNRGFGAKSGP